MDPSRPPADPVHHRMIVPCLLAVTFTAGVGALALSFVPGPFLLAPFALELTALLPGAVAAYLAQLRYRAIREALAPGPGRRGVRDAPVDEEAYRESARRAYVSLARRIQAVVNRQLGELREMEARHGADAEVFGDLMRIDHGTALIGRVADSLAVLGGDRPGRRWSRSIPVLGVLRGAMSRITEYRRVDLVALPENLAVEGKAVEALVHALAELLDNATRYSPPESRVALRAYEVPGGLAIEVEDAGVGLAAGAASRAELLLSSRNGGPELTALGQSPRLGLAVVGKLARATGFEVALRNREDGGVRAVVRVPGSMVGEYVSEPGAESALFQPGRRAANRAPGGTADAVPVRPSPDQDLTVDRTINRTVEGLPQRRRSAAERPAPDANGATGANGPLYPPFPQHTQGSQRPESERPGLWLGAFHAGLQGQQSSAQPADPHGRDGDDAPRKNGVRP